MDLRSRVLPVDRLLAIYNAIFAGFWAAYLTRTPYAELLLLAHLAALALPTLLARAPATLSRPVHTLRELYPLIWLAAFWPELDLLHQLRIPPTFDHQIRALDLALFGTHGTHVNLVWMPLMPFGWLSETMHFSYWAYYLLIGIPPLTLALTGRTAALRDVVFRMMLTYLTCYLLFILYPVYGPGLTLPRYSGPLTRGFFYELVRASLGAGDSPGCAFPSSHVAGAITIAYAGSRWFPRWISGLLWFEAIGVLVSTVYTQNHYPIDALAGLAWGLALQIAVAPAAARWLTEGRRQRAIPVPVLPVAEQT